MCLYTFYQAARKLNLGIGRNTIFEILIEKGIINERHIPRQEFIDAGYLQHEYKERFLGKTYKKIGYTVLYVSDMGLDWLRNMLLEHRTAVNR